MAQKLISVMIEEELHIKIKDYCHENDMKIKKFISDALLEKLNEKKSSKR